MPAVPVRLSLLMLQDSRHTTHPQVQLLLLAHTSHHTYNHRCRHEPTVQFENQTWFKIASIVAPRSSATCIDLSHHHLTRN